MTRRRFMLLAVALVAVNVFFWLAQSGFALPQALIQRFFGPHVIRAEVVLQANDGSIQDWRIDRGTIVAVSGGGTSLTLRERDGTLATEQVDPRAQVRPYGGSVAQLRRRMRVVVYHQANLPAEIVQVGG
jgi:hypothetical protein